MLVPRHKGLINVTCLEIVEGKPGIGLVLLGNGEGWNQLESQTQKGSNQILLCPIFEPTFLKEYLSVNQ